MSFPEWYVGIAGTGTEQAHLVADVFAHTARDGSAEHLHVATSAPRWMTVLVEVGGEVRAFVGPVSTFHAFWEPGRVLSDPEWQERVFARQPSVEASRPAWSRGLDGRTTPPEP